MNIAVVDRGVKKKHRAFTSETTGCKVVVSKFLAFKRKDQSEIIESDCHGHGSFCAGVAAVFYIHSPKPVQVSSIIEAQDSLCKLWNVSLKRNQELADIVKKVAGNYSESLPYSVGVAPFAHIYSFKVFHGDETNIEEPVAIALKEILEHNTRHQDTKEEKVHIVCRSLALHYNDKLRQAMYEVLNKDVIVVTAACNNGQTSGYCNDSIWFPAQFGNTISVGSHDIMGQPSQFSSNGREVDFLALGEEIWGPSIKGMDDVIEKVFSLALVCALETNQRLKAYHIPKHLLKKLKNVRKVTNFTKIKILSTSAA